MKEIEYWSLFLICLAIEIAGWPIHGFVCVLILVIFDIYLEHGNSGS